MKIKIHHKDKKVQRFLDKKLERKNQESNKPLCLCVFVVKYFFVLFIFCQINFAQEIMNDVEPPPLRIISKEETSKLEAEKDVKGYTKLVVVFMEARLKKAETFSLESQYQEMFSELGAFHGLVDRSLIFLTRHDTDSGKVLNNLKRLEISLRAFLPRLELIRRELPFRYEFYTRILIRFVRDARTRAIEPFYDNSIVPNIRKGN